MTYRRERRKNNWRRVIKSYTAAGILGAVGWIGGEAIAENTETELDPRIYSLGLAGLSAIAGGYLTNKILTHNEIRQYRQRRERKNGNNNYLDEGLTREIEGKIPTRNGRKMVTGEVGESRRERLERIMRGETYTQE